jgi:hypothetical protein
MRMKKLIYLAAAVTIIGAGFSSCKKTAFDINQNPNQATDSTVAYDVILPAAMTGTANLLATPWGFLQNWMGYWARSGTYAPNVIEETYQITTTFGNGIWNGAFNNAFDYQIMQSKAQRAGAGFYEGIARIMKSHNFQILVDVYGSVPYFDALRGNANPTPKYDNGAAIYRDLLRQIDTAQLLILRAPAALNKDIATNDIMFKGNKTLWMKFGNTLKLRLLVHLMNGGILSAQSTVTGFDIQAELNKIDTFGQSAANGGTAYRYLAATQDVQINPGYQTDKPNPFYTTYKNTVAGTATANNIYYRANEWGIDYYTYNGDVRRSSFYAAGPNGYLGVKYGLPPVTDNAAEQLAAIGPALGGSATAAQPIMTAAESLFLQAEAKQRGFTFTSPSAQVLLNSAISDNFRFVGAGDASAYIAGNAGYPDVDITAAPLAAGLPGGGLFTIISQKWFALNGLNTLEVWTDWRRVNYSANTPTFVYGAAVGYDPGPPLSVSPQNTSNRIPVRLLYPQTEYNYNAANVGTQGAINQFNTRIFWDLQ